MAHGEHNHFWNTVLLVNPILPPADGVGRYREILEIYKQCSCGAINKTEFLVTHEDGLPIIHT